jgi:hypothetical protein
VESVLAAHDQNFSFGDRMTRAAALWEDTPADGVTPVGIA